MNHEPVGVARSAPGVDAVGHEKHDTGAHRSHVYGQQQCIASVFDLDRQQEQQQLTEQQRQLEASKQPEHRESGQDAWNFARVAGALEESTSDEAARQYSPATSPSVSRDGPNKYEFPDDTPPDTVDGTVTEAEPVVHERVRRPVHEIVRKEVHRDIHHYDEHYRIQPVLDIKVLPTRHIFIDSQGNASELHFEGGKPPPGFEFGKHVKTYESRVRE